MCTVFLSHRRRARLDSSGKKASEEKVEEEKKEDKPVAATEEPDIKDPKMETTTVRMKSISV